ncbi:retrovirus-related pol polyprotein from transposon RE1 [Citrus sinensis]|nr:retrovirus-related pol polyprotein from transposon RE1 [Citrus sinensis]
MSSSSNLNTNPNAMNMNQSIQTTFSFITPIKFDRSNYMLWRNQVLASIRGNRLEGYINGEKAAPNQFLTSGSYTETMGRVTQQVENPEYTIWRSQDQTLLSWLLGLITEGILSHVHSCNTAYDVWKTLEKKFGAKLEARVLQLKYEMSVLRKDSLNIEDYCLKMKQIADKLACAGSPVSDKDLLQQILNGLGPGYLDLATFITASKLDFDDSYALLLTHETRLEQSLNENQMLNANLANVSHNNNSYGMMNAYYAQTRGNPRICGYNGGFHGGNQFGRNNFHTGRGMFINSHPRGFPSGSGNFGNNLGRGQMIGNNNKQAQFMRGQYNVNSGLSNSDDFAVTSNESFSQAYSNGNIFPPAVVSTQVTDQQPSNTNRNNPSTPTMLPSVPDTILYQSSDENSQNQHNNNTSHLHQTVITSPSLNQHPMITRGKADIFKPKVYTVVLLHKEPDTIQEAINVERWFQPMKAEYDALMSNGTWTLVPRTEHHKLVGNKWVFRVKSNTDGSVAKYKARLVAKGFQQIEGVNYFETFSPVVKAATVRVVLSLAVMNQWQIRQVDVNNAFLNGDLIEEVYMSQPEGFIDSKRPNFVCKLHKALYGLKQAPRAWFDKLRNSLMQWGFENYFIKLFSSAFALKDLGKLSYFLGIEVLYDFDSVYLSQRKYIRNLLAKVDMLECKEINTPMSNSKDYRLQKNVKGEMGYYIEDPSHYRSIVGGLQYLVLTRPEIAYSVHKLSQYVASPTLQHLMACKRVLRYLKETQDYGLKFVKEGELKVAAFTDADWGSDLDDIRSTGAYCVYLENNLISWSSKKQSVVTKSSAESEYRALAAAVSEITWLKSLFLEIDLCCVEKPVIWCDNVSAKELAYNPVFHSRTKHIEINPHFIRDKVLAGDLKILYVPSAEQIADIMTKPLNSTQFIYLRKKFNVHLCPLSLREAVKKAHCAELRKERKSEAKVHQQCHVNNAESADSVKKQ